MLIRVSQYTSFVFILFLFTFFSCGQKSDESTSSTVEEIKTSPVKEEKKTILFFGNSLTAGYGLEPEESFAGIIQHRRSEEHTSELQSRPHLVCRLLLEKKKKNRKSK